MSFRAHQAFGTGARDDVGNDLLVGMAEMRLAVDVINRGGDVKPFAHYQTRSVADNRGDGKRESGPAGHRKKGLCLNEPKPRRRSLSSD